MKSPPAKPAKPRRHHNGCAQNRASVFLAAYRVTGNIKMAAEASKVDKVMHYRRMKTDPKYRAAFELAKKEAIELLEDEAQRRAVHGVYRPVFWQGEEVGRELVYSDSMLQFLLRGEKPEKYRDRYQGDSTTNINLKFSGGMEQLLALYHELTTQQAKVIDVTHEDQTIEE